MAHFKLKLNSSHYNSFQAKNLIFVRYNTRTHTHTPHTHTHIHTHTQHTQAFPRCVHIIRIFSLFL